ncbi:MAG: Hsp20/alpha crystallin family protein [Methanosarcinaceae archaeon]|nr:Hsp20/alpha crystallin family protein [Methanosarcinaceae archaeon]
MTKDETQKMDGKESAPKRLNSFFNKFMRRPVKSGSGAGKYSQAPLMDLIDRKDEIILRADVPGVTKKDIVLEIQDRVLTIVAEYHEEESGKYIRRERFYNSYEGGIHIPVEIDEERATAKLSNGILTVVLPKKKAEKNPIEVF